MEPCNDACLQLPNSTAFSMPPSEVANMHHRAFCTRRVVCFCSLRGQHADRIGALAGVEVDACLMVVAPHEG